MAGKLTLCHLENGLPLLPEINLVKLYYLLDRGLKVLATVKEEKLDFLGLLNLLGPDFVAEAQSMAKDLGTSRVLRRISAIATATENEMLAAEKDPDKMSLLLDRAALYTPEEALEALSFFTRRSVKQEKPAPGSSATVAPAAGLPAATSGSSAES